MRKNNQAVPVILITIALFFIINDAAHAGNGTRFMGFSSRDMAMGGATTASSEDTSCLIRNPAGLIKTGNRIDAEYLNIIPHDVTMHTEGPATGTARRGAMQYSTVGYIPGGNAGVSYMIPGCDPHHPVAVGCGTFTMAGVALDYPSSKSILPSNGVYNKMVDLRIMRIAPGLAVGLTDNISFGAAANIEIQGLKTDLAKSDRQETAGSGKWDFVAGGGYTLGLLYKFSEMLGLGASYESHGWNGHHHKYKDVLPYIDQPPVINMGVSFKPIKDFEWTYDTRYINWTDVKMARNTPMGGGFGWRDQWVFATGGEYNFKNKLKARLGYMYGRSPIQPHVVYANALIPLIMEHHLTAGLSYFLTKDLSLDVAWEHAFRSVMADDGQGDAQSQNGNGTKISAAADIIGIGIGYKF